MDNQLQKALNLSRKTGDRLIVFDSSGGTQPFVILPIEEYEDLIGTSEPIHKLTDGQLIDKINRDIANWKIGREQNAPARPKKAGDWKNFFDHDRDHYDFTGEIRKADDENPDDYAYDPFDFSRDEWDGISGKEEKADSKKAKNHWQIPSERKEAAEEVIEEDRHYLEEVPF